ncbi:carboxypeptidase A2-like [Achroia grisella]|uniref:carboxypeptidase A2-like n=1 Tax=Achroia grisella TaxID=688607 RepID=UPI0027D2E03F|nr:carboxypeptidase A2-like [Achroia grisella]
MNNLEYDYPSICTTRVIGQSLEGRDLKILKISNSDAGNAAVWLDAGIHAREWIAPAVAKYIADYISKNFENLPSSFTNKDWYFLPVMNPDGYEYSHIKERLWRKNKAWHGGQCVGVDLNRNFSYGWGGKGSSNVPTNAFYRGPEPFSEPESSAVRDILSNYSIPFKVYITLHSYGQVILFPFAFKDELCHDYIRLLEGATVMAKAIHECNGNTYKVGISRDVMYGAAGTSNDWSYGAVGIPYCYLIELRSKQHKFKLPNEEIKETANEILNCVKALMEFVDIRYFCIILPILRYPVKVAHLKNVTQVWEVKVIKEGQRCFVKSLDTTGAINIWKEEHSTMDVMVEGSRAAQVSGMLHERDIPFSVAIGDVSAMVDREQGETFRRNSVGIRPIMDWKHYHRLDVIYAFLETLAAEYPYLCTVTTIGNSAEGRDIKMLKISNGNDDNTGVWLDGSIHPREWITTAVVTYIADQLTRTYQSQPVSITNKDWYIVPVLNPDGYEYTHTHDRMWRKNRAKYGECIGVDLNRNFSYGWGEKDEEGSSEDPGNIFFRGSKPFSEPETDAVRRTITESGATFKAFLSFHSYGEVIIFPWGYTGDPCPDYVELLEGGTAMAKAIKETSGHTYKVGSTKDLMYFAAGTSTDWSYAVANIPYSYMIELRGKKHRFLLPKEEIISTSLEVFNGVLRLMEFIDTRCISSQSCVCPK